MVANVSADLANSIYNMQEEPTVDFTVAIRVYNSGDRIAEILEKLLHQTDTEEINWEIVIVDNNSTDNTAQIIQQYQAQWCKPYSLRYFLETRQGAVFARARAIREAKGQYIGFLDDDNFPCSTWVSAAYTFGQAHPQVGAYGSRIQGRFDVEPPKNFERIQSFLALKERGETANQYDPSSLSLPAGAGLVVRKQVWLNSVPERLNLQGPVGGKLTAKGEDFEALLHIGQQGWEIWYNPEMKIDHHIPGWRLERDYLISLIHNVGLTICQLRMINAKNWQKPIIMLRIIVGNSRRIIQHWMRYRGGIQEDVVLSCEMAFYWSSLISPFVYLKQQIMH